MKYIQKSEVDGSQEESLKRDRQRVFFTAGPDDNGQSIEGISVRLGQAKDRTIDQYFRTSSKDGKMVQFRAGSEERIAILSNTIKRNRSLQFTTCDLY